MRIFIGYDSKEAVAYHVLAHSIQRRASCPVSIHPVMLSQLGSLYRRPRGPLESTEFSMSRFLVPTLSGYSGWSIFMDCDMLCQVDVAELWKEIEKQEDKAVLVCKHDYVPKDATKFNGNIQTAYPRKNWSSFVAFNNGACMALRPDFVNRATGLELHRFLWLKDEQIGSLPLEWNWLSGEYAVKRDAKVIHYTNGGPWFDAYANCDHADLWQAELEHMLGH